MTRVAALSHNGREWRKGQPVRIPATRQECTIIACYKGATQRDNLISLQCSDGERMVVMPDSLEARS